MASASTLMSQQGPLTLVHTEKLKLMIKGSNLRKNAIYWYKSCSARFSILGENPSEEVLDYDNYYYDE